MTTLCKNFTIYVRIIRRQPAFPAAGFLQLIEKTLARGASGIGHRLALPSSPTSQELL
jgi:hypothetical protein